MRIKNNNANMRDSATEVSDNALQRGEGSSGRAPGRTPQSAKSPSSVCARKKTKKVEKKG